MPRPARSALLVGMALTLALGVLAGGIGTAGQHYTATITNAAKAIGSFVGTASAGEVSAANGVQGEVSFSYTIGSRLNDPDTALLFADWRSCIIIRSGISITMKQCIDRPQIAVVDPLLLFAIGKIYTDTCEAFIFLTVRRIGGSGITPILDIVPERVSVEAGALVFGKRGAILRIGHIKCKDGFEGDIVAGKGWISRTYNVDVRSAVIEPTPTPTESPPEEA